MMNVIDFIRESAKFLVSERPDVYDQETAVEELSTAIYNLREGTHRVEVIMFTSFIIMRYLEDGLEEFVLARKVSGMILDDEDEEFRAFSYHRGLDGLPHILDMNDGDMID